MADWNTTLIIPPLDLRNYSPNDWNAWITQFKLRAVVTPFFKLPDQDKLAILLMKLGDDVAYIFESFNLDIDQITYEQLIQRFNAYFNTIKARHVFLNTKQKTGESFEKFAKRLSILSLPCCFGPFLDGLRRDVFLSNMDAMFVNIRDLILTKEDNISFNEVLSLSNELLIAECKVSCGSLKISETNPTLSTAPIQPIMSSELPTEDPNKEQPNFKTSRIEGPQRQSDLMKPSDNEDRKSSHCVANAMKAALESSTPKLTTIDNVPKIDFSFKCFNDTGKPYDETVRSNMSQPLETTKDCHKTSSVSSRLSKFGNRGQVEDVKSTIYENNSKSKSQSKTDERGSRVVNKVGCYNQERLEKNSNQVVYKNDCAIDAKPSSLFVERGNSAQTATLADRAFLNGVKSPCGPEPPVSKSIFTNVVVVYISEKDDTIFVCPLVKYEILDSIETELKTLNDRNALPSLNMAKYTVGVKYAAPYNGEWFRAEIIGVNVKMKNAKVSFCDYGNEEDVRLSDLRILPEKFQDLEPLSFAIRLPKGAPFIRSGSRIKIRPLFLEEDDCIWAVELLMT